jgi:enoyl-CoA hydratase/carnithine racemase
MSARTLLHFENFVVTFPDERIIQVTLTRTKKLNCIDKATSREIAKIWEHLDEDETLWVGIITGSGRAFCTGADLQGRHHQPVILGQHSLTTAQNGMR